MISNTGECEINSAGGYDNGAAASCGEHDCESPGSIK